MTVDIEGAHTSEDEGSLASIRERIKQQRVFSGHPSDLAGPIGGDEEEEPQGKHVQPPAEDTGGGSLEDEDGKGGEAPKPPKYKSLEEAEKATTEADAQNAHSDHPGG